MSGLFRAIVLYGALNAVAYACLLPLWEGFDEGFHYGYVQLLSTGRSFPVLNNSFLSQEIWRSYELTPVSHYLQPYTGAPLNFATYFAMAPAARADLHRQLMSIEARRKFAPQPDKPNYEVNQSPLPYVFMAAIDYTLSNRPLPARVFWLRLICSSLAVLLIAHSTLLLAREIALPELFTNAVLFCAFSSQMLMAVIAHVCNDCFAVPAMAYLIWSAVRAARTGNSREWLGMGIALSAALLIKAYFLFLLPTPACVLAWSLYKHKPVRKQVTLFAAPLLLCVAPWYARNMILYHSLSGTSADAAGFGMSRFLKAALTLPWPASIRYMAHTSLWTGNNSFTTFSATTLDILLFLLGLGAVLYALRAKPVAAEVLPAASIFFFCCGIAIISVSFYSATHGGAIAAVPWYQQVLLVPFLLIVFSGLHRWRKPGAAVLASLVLLWTYLALATYWVKLVPLYGGFPEGPARIGTLWAWYARHSAERDAILGNLCMVSPLPLWSLLICVSALGVTLSAILVICVGRILRSHPSPGSSAPDPLY